MAEIMAIVASAAAAAQARAGAGGPVGSALDLLARDAPAALSDPTLLGNLVFVVENGGGDLAGLLGWALKLLGDHPQ
jgi:cytochrome P450